jgi:hypothetical protein
VTTKPGEWVYVEAELVQVAKVEVFASLPVEPVMPSEQGSNFNPWAGE